MHLIFDCDGVLIDSEYVAVHVMLRVLEPFGYVSNFEEFSSTFTGMLDTKILAHIAKEHQITFPDNFYQQIEAERDKAFEEDLKPIAGMTELIKSLAVEKSVVSNSHVAHVEKALELCDLTGEFGGRIYSSEHVAQPKPDPAVYLFALQSLGLTTEDVWVIEDSLTGVSSAKAAGCKVIGFLGGKHIMAGHEEKLQKLGADHIAANAEELTELLQAYR